MVGSARGIALVPLSTRVAVLSVRVAGLTPLQLRTGPRRHCDGG